MIKLLLSKSHLIIFLYTAYSIYSVYTAHEKRLLDLNDQIPVIQNKITKAQKAKKQLQRYYEQEEKEKAKIEKVAREIEKLQRQLPSKISEAEDVQTLTLLAKKLNIRVDSISPQNEENKGFYFTKDYVFRGVGTFLQFLIYFEKIETLSLTEKLFNIGVVALAKPEGRQKGRFQLVEAEFNVQTYRYNPDHKEDRGIEAVEKMSKKKVRPRRKKKKR